MSVNTGAMIAFFVPLPVASELGQMASAAMPEHAEAAEGMHLTVVYLGEAEGLDAQNRVALKDSLAHFATLVSPLGGCINGITRFVDNDPNAIVANFDAPGLADLRASLINLCRLSGIQPVLNHGYTPHVTLAYLPESETMPTLNLKPIQCPVDSFTLALGDERTVYPLVGTNILSEVSPMSDVVLKKPVAADGNQLLDTGSAPDEKKSVAEISLSTPTFAFVGKPPEIPFANGVDIAQLTAGDPGEPLFVVRPLAVLNGVSDADIEYDRELCAEIRQQVHEKKPAARQGHISKDNIDWEFPDDVGLWVGAEMIDGTLWGKAFIYPGTPFHQMVRKRKAAGSTLSNSIWGKANWISKPNGRKSLRGLDLESIDFAPAERASLGALGGAFGTTSEMAQPQAEGETNMSDVHADKDQDLALLRSKVSEMEPGAVHEMLTPVQRQHVAQMHFGEMEPSAIYEMMKPETRASVHECWVKEFAPPPEPVKETTAEMKGDPELVRRISEMDAANKENMRIIAEFRQKEFDSAIDRAVETRFAAWGNIPDSYKDAFTATKGTVKLHLVAQMKGSNKIEDIEPAATRAWEVCEPNIVLLRTAVSGGNVIVGPGTVSETSTTKHGWNAQTGRYEDTAAAAARQQLGL